MTTTLATHRLYSLSTARMLVEMTQQQLASASGISLTTISKIENGKTPYATHAGVAWALADALAVSVDEIDWPHGLSYIGRPPKTGKKIEVARTSRPTTTCPDCSCERAINGTCMCI